MSKRIPFNIKYRPQIESGEYKVETRSGLPARIICWDKKTKDMEILALVYDEHIDEDNEELAEVALNGRMFPHGKDHDYDLFIVTPEEELSRFEEGLNAFLFDFVHTTIDEDPIEYVKKNSGVLLSPAREQIIKDGYVIEKKAFHDAVEKVEPEVMKEVSENIDLENFIHNLSERYPEVSFAKLTRIAKAAYDYGKAEALKDLPRWRKANGKERFNERLIVLVGDNDILCTNYAEDGEHYIFFSDLEKLPKED